LWFAKSQKHIINSVKSQRILFKISNPLLWFYTRN
jgi:hypothetical protein